MSKAVETGNLPNVAQLSFNGSKGSIHGKLHLLFRCKWEKLVNLDLAMCSLDPNDVQIVCAETTGSKTVLLPSLSSLAVSDNGVSGSCDQFRKEWLGLRTLEINDSGSHESMFKNGLKNKRFPSVENFKMSLDGMVQLENLIPNDLKSLSIVHSKSGENYFNHLHNHLNLQNLREKISQDRLRYLNLSYNVLSDSLCYILCRTLPNLETLILRSCSLNAADLQVLAQANSENNLPKLKHLDIAFNPLNYLRYLFEDNTHWSGLLSFTTDWMRFNSELSMNSLAEAGKSGSLRNVESLSFFTERHFLNIIRDSCRTCESLMLKLHSAEQEYSSQRQFLQSIDKALENGLFSSLRSVYIHSRRFIKCDAAAEKLKLRKRGVSVYFLLFSEN